MAGNANTPPAPAKALPVSLRSLRLGERWLQTQIGNDPSLLGLGELEIVGREYCQTAAGRLDFLMRDPRQRIYYEVELMLGALDESHIVRAIEYWDLERQRRPYWDHRAVIVAENITARFFNVLRLFNRTIPLIAIKLSAFRIHDRIILHPVTVLDVTQEKAAMERLDFEAADRSTWESKSPPCVTAMDKVMEAMRNFGLEPQVQFNHRHIALGTTSRNFCWIAPRRQRPGCSVEVRLSRASRDHILAKLGRAEIVAEARRKDAIAFHDVVGALDAYPAAMSAVLQLAEDKSHAPIHPEPSRDKKKKEAEPSNVELFVTHLPMRRRPKKNWWVPPPHESNGP